MAVSDLIAELDAIAGDDDFESLTNDVTDAWMQRGVGLDGVRAILAFMEAHPDLEYGAPGALVHFAERFYRKGYEAELVDSLSRKPIAHTAWMLNRIINGTQAPDDRTRYVVVLERARDNPAADARTRAEITHFLGLHAQGA